MHLLDTWIALRNLWIHTLRRNPWIVQGSCLRDLWIFHSEQFCWLSVVRLSSETPSWYQQKAVREQITIKSLDTVTRHIQLFLAAAIYSVHVAKYQQTCWYSRINKHVDILSCLCKYVTIANYCICRAVHLRSGLNVRWTKVKTDSLQS